MLEEKLISLGLYVTAREGYKMWQTDSVRVKVLDTAPLSSWYARRLGAAQPPPAELAGVSDLRQRRSALAKFER